MPDSLWLERQAELSLTRLLPRLEARFHKEAKVDPVNWYAFTSRLRANFEPLFQLLLHLYGSQYDFFLQCRANFDHWRNGSHPDRQRPRFWLRPLQL